MQFDSYVEPRPVPHGPEKRANGRFRLVELASNLGPVLDLSAHGVRIQSRRPLQGEIDVELKCFDGQTLPLRARVVWSNRRGWRKHHVGLNILNVTGELANEIMQTALAHAPVVQT